MSESDMKHTIERGPVFAQLLKQLIALEYQPKFLDAIIPSWWTPEAEASPNGLEHLKLLLAQYLGPRHDRASSRRQGQTGRAVRHELQAFQRLAARQAARSEPGLFFRPS